MPLSLHEDRRASYGNRTFNAVTRACQTTIRTIFMGLGETFRFWECRRAVYNVLLTAVTIGWLIATWPHFRMALNPSSLLRFAGLTVLANVCYCAAYLVDIPMEHSSLSVGWRRGRRALWLLGTLFAIVLANYWIADEI